MRIAKWIFLIDVLGFKSGEIVDVNHYFEIILNKGDIRDKSIIIGIMNMKSINLDKCVVPLAEWRNEQIDKILKDE